MDESTAASLLAFAEVTTPRMDSLDAKAAFDALEDRYDELLAALGWYVEAPRPDQAYRLAGELVRFWMATNRLAEGWAWFDRVLSIAPAGTAQYGRALYEAGYLAFWQGDDAGAGQRFDAALAIGRNAADPTLIALTLAALARIALRTDVEAARRLCREALDVTAGTADRSGRSSAIHVLAVANQMAGDLEGAKTLMLERIESARATGNASVLATEAANLSVVERQLGNLDAADALGRESLEIDVQRGDDWAKPYSINGLAAVAVERGQDRYAAMMIGSAEAMVEAQGAGWPPDERVTYEATVDRLRASMGDVEYERARSLGRAMSIDEAVRHVRNGPTGTSSRDLED